MSSPGSGAGSLQNGPSEPSEQLQKKDPKVLTHWPPFPHSDRSHSFTSCSHLRGRRPDGSRSVGGLELVGIKAEEENKRLKQGSEAKRKADEYFSDNLFHLAFMLRN